MLLRTVAAIVVMAGLASCASIVSGTSQTLTLDTVPSGADCSLSRKGLVIGRVNPTPGAVFVQRTRDDITVSCTKEGYQTGSLLNKSGLEAATLGNIILGGLVGVVIDSASGANNKYDEKMRIVLAPTNAETAGAKPDSSNAAAQQSVAQLASSASTKPVSDIPPDRVAPEFNQVADFHCPARERWFEIRRAAG